MNNLIIRQIQPQEYSILEDFLYHSIFLPPDAGPLPRDIIFEPEIFVYIKDFGLKDDCGVVAEHNGEIVGAAWTRIIPAYGHIDHQTPELVISVLPDWRGKSVGSQMMQFLFDVLCERGYLQTSLSVQKDNPALRLYERLGYQITGDRTDHAGNEDYLMIKNLQNIKTMNNETTNNDTQTIQTIHELDLNMIYDYFSNTERQGPGNPEITLRALSFIEGLTEKSKIADIGCGTGGQTMTLAENTPCEITAVDLWPDFVEKVNQNAEAKKLQNRVKGVVGDMTNLPFGEEEFDLIWSEGAIYNIGFERGLTEWRKFLKPGGYVAVTENTWFTNERPAEIQEFWDKAYPEMDTIPNKIAQMQKAGYLPTAVFFVPETCWTDFYDVQHPKMNESFLKKYSGNPSAEELIRSEAYEVELYRKYKAYYGYMFYIGKKV